MSKNKCPKSSNEVLTQGDSLPESACAINGDNIYFYDNVRTKVIAGEVLHETIPLLQQALGLLDSLCAHPDVEEESDLL